MDPAVTDRTCNPILGVTDRDLPVRSMTVSGIENNIKAKILSTDLRGAATRIVVFPPGWGSRLTGSFTGDVGVFVLQGDLRVGSVALRDYEYVSIPSGGVIGRFTTENGVIALLMTSKPIRYDTSRGGAPADLVVGRPSETSWSRHAENSDLFIRPVCTSKMSTIWLGSVMAPVHDVTVWTESDVDEETFVLEGRIEYMDEVDEKIVVTKATAGSYFYRPAGTRHTAPMRIGEETVMTFHRSMPAGMAERAPR
jgi:hypothetical protein